MAQGSRAKNGERASRDVVCRMCAPKHTRLILETATLEGSAHQGPSGICLRQPPQRDHLYLTRRSFIRRCITMCWMKDPLSDSSSLVCGPGRAWLGWAVPGGPMGERRVALGCHGCLWRGGLAVGVLLGCSGGVLEYPK